MANILCFYICSVLLAAIAGHDFLFTEGRQLKETMQWNFESYTRAKLSYDHKTASKSTAYGFGSSLAGDVNTFQPTSPGNSPGVGHSHSGLTEVEVNTGNVQPMVTGHSPGVGHSTKDAKVEPIS